MRAPASALVSALLIVVCGLPQRALSCADPGAALGVSRMVEIDAGAGPIFGDMTEREKEPTFLGPKEVVLTFDDGPIPRITLPILDTLDRFCTKATFFSVGEMALAYPATAREIVSRGHTLGAHTWSHPLNLRRLSLERASDQIERGFAAVALAAGQPIAPFFRFPGLSDSDALLSHLQTRGIASFTVDVVSNDSYIGSAERLVAHTLRQVEARQGGILLFHDIKSVTAKALPHILEGLKERGYTVVHMVPKAPLVPVALYDRELSQVLARAENKAAADGGAAGAARSGTAEPPKTLTGEVPPIAFIAPAARTRSAVASAADALAHTARDPSLKGVRQGGAHRMRRSRRAATAGGT
jgi:peptidoglycan/xylan/chitin deacetylase (PgdA/CDA1 family)